MTERQARGNILRPKPPRTSLSYSERSDDIETDETLLEQMWKTEELESQERQARKIGEEVGYLFFVGDIDGLDEWREDYLRSDRQLVYRKAFSEPRFENAEHESETEEDTDSEEDEESPEEMDTNE
jgi:hypothetical protein